MRTISRTFSFTHSAVWGWPAKTAKPVGSCGLDVDRAGRCGHLGHQGDELLLASTKVVPEAARRLGFRFEYPVLEDALRHTLGRRRGLPDGMEVETG